jgi:hypothetical protein
VRYRGRRRLPRQVRHQGHRTHRAPITGRMTGRDRRVLQRPRHPPRPARRLRLPTRHPAPHQTTEQQRADWHDTYGRLRRWTHMLGFGGHFATKSAATRRRTSSCATVRPNTSAPPRRLARTATNHRDDLVVDTDDDTTSVSATCTWPASVEHHRRRPTRHRSRRTRPRTPRPRWRRTRFRTRPTRQHEGGEHRPRPDASSWRPKWLQRPTQGRPRHCSLRLYMTKHAHPPPASCRSSSKDGKYPRFEFFNLGVMCRILLRVGRTRLRSPPASRRTPEDNRPRPRQRPKDRSSSVTKQTATRRLLLVRPAPGVACGEEEVLYGKDPPRRSYAKCDQALRRGVA